MRKPQRYLTDKEANSLGLDLNTKTGNRTKAKYSIDDDVWDKILLHRSSGKELKPEPKPEPIKKQAKETPFVLSAWNTATGLMMDIDEYCEFYKLPRKDIKSYKLVSHTGTPFYNILFKECKEEINDYNFDNVKDILNNTITKDYKYKTTKHSFNKENVLKWSDLHFGAYIRNIMHVQDFDADILLDGLLNSAYVNNNFGFKKTHVHINGDLIESFSGLNHINSWMSMDKDMIGANVIKMCTEMLEKVFNKINNLGCIKIVAGNHDRTSKANDEDVKGGAAELIAYCLTLKGFDVEFHPYVITHFVEGINHINLHGDKGISKKSTEKIILDYGIQGEYNLINEGHLHSVIEKLSIKQRESFEVLKDDSILHRRFYLPSFFPGNYYSATLGYTTNPGYFIIWSNNKKRPQFFNGSV